MAPYDAISWSGTRRVGWGDFRGRPPAGGPEAARTAYSVFYAWKCTGERFEFRAVAALLPGQSWVKAVVLRDSAQSRRTLGHERTHFDLAEVYARKLRARFREITGACRRSDAQLDAEAGRLLDELRDEQRRYDGETRNGLDAERQARWERNVAALLASLRARAP